MLPEPTPYVVADSAPAGDAPEGAIPISLFGGAAGGEFSELQGSVAGVAGTNLQGILADLATRLSAVESA